MAEEKVGTIHPKGTMFLRHDVGTADDGKGHVFEMTVHAGNMSPLVCCEKTGKYFHLSWTDIIGLAVAAGIEEAE